MDRQPGSHVCEVCGETFSAGSASGVTICRCGPKATKSALSGTAISRAVGIGIAVVLLLFAFLHR